MKLKNWIVLSLTSLVIVSSVGYITKHRSPVQPNPNPAVVSTIQPTTTTEIVTQAPNTQSRSLIKAGNFESGEHPTQGKARIVQQNGRSILELDKNFKTSSSGPDLVVVLHRSSNVLGMTTPPAFPLKEGDYVVLAPLKKFDGAQQYAIPNNLNLENVQSAVIWCRQFNATFGAATLS